MLRSLCGHWVEGRQCPRVPRVFTLPFLDSPGGGLSRRPNNYSSPIALAQASPGYRYCTIEKVPESVVQAAQPDLGSANGPDRTLPDALLFLWTEVFGPLG